MSTNIYHIYSLLSENKKIEFEGYEKFLFENIFHGFSSYQFKKIIDISHVNNCYQGQTIIEQDIFLDEIYLIINGKLEISVHGQSVASLKTGDFVGEMSFITNEKTKANVIASSADVRVLSWNTKKLKNLLSKHPELNSLFTATLGRQLISELMERSLKDSSSKKDSLKLVA